MEKVLRGQFFFFFYTLRQVFKIYNLDAAGAKYMPS